MQRLIDYYTFSLDLAHCFPLINFDEAFLRPAVRFREFVVVDFGLFVPFGGLSSLASEDAGTTRLVC